MRAMGRCCGSACVLALLVAMSAHEAHAATGAGIARKIRAGDRVVLPARTVVRGELDLGAVDVAKAVFKCRECIFNGRVYAPDVVFERTIDLSGSTFRSDVVLTGSTFRGPALFRAPTSETESTTRNKPGCRFAGDADFSLAIFDDIASFAGSRFCGDASFRDARFSDATFTRAWFETAGFSGAGFRGVALFNDATFGETALFASADFRRRVDFARAKFKNGAVLTDTRFGDGGSFLATRFAATTATESATLQNATSAGDLNLTFAKFVGEIATFSDVVVGGALIFREVEFDETHGVTMSHLQVRNLVLAVDAVDLIPDDEQRREVLQTIETSAKDRGDLVTANGAHYELNALRSRDYGAVARTLDYVFYRGIAGYFVRPLRPIAVLLAVGIALALWRMRSRRAEVGAPAPTRRRRVWNGTRRRCADFFTCLLDTLAVAGPKWGGNRATPLALSQRFEVIAYRLLLACAVIGLANSNPTLRQMVDTLL